MTSDVEAMLEYFEKAGIRKPLAHAPYVLNPCAKDQGLRQFARQTMAEDLAKLEQIPDVMYNLHPGSHVGQGTEAGIRLIADALNQVLGKEQHTVVLLETMAGKGSEMGRSFGELAAILSQVECADHLGICLDTCHVWDAGYDIVENLEGVLEEFDKVLGLGRLKAIHLNDSMNGRGSHKDRHEKIGKGQIGEAAFERIVNHPALRDLPFYLETPNELEGYGAEIALLKGKRR